MVRLSLVAVSLLTATASQAQTYPSALPLTSAEQRALEVRLASILDYAQPGAIQRMDLPGGGQAAVRPYNMVRTSNGQTCRGYRIDVDGQAGRSAVDGYRCRLSSGGAWVITEPETLISQGGPVNLQQSQSGAGGAQFAEESRDPNAFATSLRERLGRGPSADADPYGNAERETADTGPAPLFDPGETPPVPREAPARLASTEDPEPSEAAARDPNVEGGAPNVADAESDAPTFAARDVADQAAPAAPDIEARPVNANATSSDATTLPSTTAPAVVARIRTPSADQPADPTAPAAGADMPVRSADDTARVVGGRFGQASNDTDADGRVVAALRELHYLDPAAPTSSAAVETAIDDFARDERFALPVPSSTLLARLNDALDRSSSLPPCTADTTTMCVAR